MRKPDLRVLIVTLFLLSPTAVHAQQPTVTMPGDAGHAASGLFRTFFGNGYRDAWTVPITVPVLDLATFAGGLTAFREGGNQSRTLRFQAGNGKVYQFRSTRKFLPRAMPEDLQDTPAGALIQDQSSAMHPTGHLIASRLQVAAGVLHSVPQMVVLPDDPRLGEFREAYAGMMGQLEERPQDYEDKEQLNFGGAEKIIDPDKLIENLEETMEHRFDAQDYLRARLMDILVGDTDRGADQWQFARYEAGDRDVYRSIPRDRDYAFMNSDGLIIRLVAMVYSKLVLYNERFAPLGSYLFMTREFDRTHLSELTWQDWERVISGLETSLTDRVIDEAIMRLPAEHRQVTGPKLAAALKTRRSNLREYARKYYHAINEEADVFASDEDERAEVERHSDGSVTVRIFREGDDRRPAWERRFVPSETSEIRLYLERGNDRVVVRGGAPNTIDVRIVGGEGDDVLIDSTRVSGRTTFTTFYDAYGQNTFVRGPHTRVSEKPYVTSQPIVPEDEDDDEEDKKPERIAQEERRGRYQDLMNAGQGFIEQKTSSEWIRAWGEQQGLLPAIELREGTGLIIGVGHRKTDFGFRRTPYETSYMVTGLVSPTTGRLGAQLVWDRHPENSNWSYSLFARGTQFEANRFYGFGNETPDVDLALSLVRRTEIVVFPSLNYRLGSQSFFSVGPVYKWNKAHVEDGSPAFFQQPFGTTESLSQLGVRLETVINTAAVPSLPRSGFTLRAGASSYPAMQDIPEPFHEVHGVAATYLSIGSPVLALRVGGQHVWGDAFPLHEAAFIGGQSTLRGYRFNRFAGDASVFGGAELRLPITRAVLFTRGDLGILGLVDAGRVWAQGESTGDWHTAFGGGVWFQTLGQLLTLSYAQGEDEGRIYFKMGAPF
jgi:hypothetical protein